MKYILAKILFVYARLTLLIHRPRIVGITGSVGKTSTKDAITTVLRAQLSVGESFGNLNSHLGLPLSILRFDRSGGSKPTIRTVFNWLMILITGFFKIFQTNYPKILVLEMGAGKLGDIDYLVKIVKNLDVAVITDIGISHLEYFQTVEQLAEEKFSILKGLTSSGAAVLNADNPRVLAGKSRVKGQAITYGLNPEADVSAIPPRFVKQGSREGLEFEVKFQTQTEKFFIPNVIGKTALYSSLAAAAVGIYFQLDLKTIAQSLSNYQQPSGRLKIIPGIKRTTIIDDTYNAAPDSVLAALEALNTIKTGRRLAALGAMAELGSQTEAGHRAVADKIIEHQLDVVFLVGEHAKIIEDQLRAKGFVGQVSWFGDADAAKAVVAQNLRDGDAILVKGSQSARMEKIVKEIMNEPQAAPKLLVRQNREWLNSK